MEKRLQAEFTRQQQYGSYAYRHAIAVARLYSKSSLHSPPTNKSSYKRSAKDIRRNKSAFKEQICHRSPSVTVSSEFRGPGACVGDDRVARRLLLCLMAYVFCPPDDGYEIRICVMLLWEENGRVVKQWPRFCMHINGK